MAMQKASHEHPDVSICLTQRRCEGPRTNWLCYVCVKSLRFVVRCRHRLAVHKISLALKNHQ